MSKEAVKLMLHEMEYVLDCINNHVVPFDGDDFHEALRLGRQSIAEAEKQEPFAWMEPDWADGTIFRDSEVNKTTDFFHDHMIPLYTTPYVPTGRQQRTWVGLTDEELQDIFNEPDLPEFVTESVRAIEAKLKEKNT